MNKAILMGNLVRDPEVRYSQSAEPLAICKYTVAVSRKFKRDGEPDTDFINCVVFGKSAEFAQRYFKKGMRILVTGRIQISSWDDPQTNQKRWSTDIVVEEQEFAESKSSFESRANSYNDSAFFGAPSDPSAGDSQPAPQKPNYEPKGFSAIAENINDDDDDLPFF